LYERPGILVPKIQPQAGPLTPIVTQVYTNSTILRIQRGGGSFEETINNSNVTPCVFQMNEWVVPFCTLCGAGRNVVRVPFGCMYAMYDHGGILSMMARNTFALSSHQLTVS
jgi:hypothetical protein